MLWTNVRRIPECEDIPRMRRVSVSSCEECEMQGLLLQKHELLK